MQPMNPQTIDLELSAMAHGGSALGRHQGRVIFVPYTIPGERVRVEIVQDKERYAHARLLEVLNPSPDRVEPPCPHFGTCGGCQWQHIAYQRQVALKSEIVADQLQRIGHVQEPTVEPTLPAPQPWGYRNRLTFGVGANRTLGFQKLGSHEIVAIETCLIADPRLMALYDDLDLDLPGLTRLTLLAGSTEDDLLMALETQGDKAPELSADFPISCVHLVGERIPVNLIGRNYVTFSVGGWDYRVSAGRFFQVNTALAGGLVDLALKGLDPGLDDTVLDGYCGVGLFSLPLAERTGLVVAVETDPGATEDLILNMGDLDNIDVIQGPVEVVLPDLAEPLDGAVVDPPRSGVAVEVVDALVDEEKGPARLVYVSCDPATLARDVRRLMRGGYRLVEVQPVDLFPQTYHVETVALMER